MLKGIDVNQRIEFSSVHDKEENKTIFVFRPMTSVEMMELASSSEGGVVTIKGNKIFEYLEKSIVEIRNYPVTTVKEALPTLPMDVLTELIKEMDRINKITDEQRKNS